MEKKDFYFLGKITKTSGYQGNLMFFFDVDDIRVYQNLEAVIIELDEELIPFAIESIAFKNNQPAFVSIVDIHSEKEATPLVGCDLYLPLKFLPPLKGTKFYYHELTGFSVIDAKMGNIGILESVLDQGPQAIFQIMNNKKEILIPITDEIVKKVDRQKKRILVDAPEGLIDIYL